MFASSSHRALIMLTAPTVIATVASAHVTLMAPNGGEELQAGTSYPICWSPLVEHELIDWDIWYSTESATGPWLVVEENLPPGDPTAGSEHTYDWTPDFTDDSVWVRVIQDNVRTDYWDTSAAPFTIIAAECLGDFDGNGGIGFADLNTMLSRWGTCSASPCTWDLNTDGSVGFVDLNLLLAAWGQCP